jgi:hypothetical protein
MLPMALQFLIVMIASAINDRLQRKLDYVEEERCVLQEQLDTLTGGKRLSFTADQRRRLATAGELLTADERRRWCHIVKPATILEWFRQLAARKYDSSEARHGRPAKPKDVRKLVVEMAMANPGWGYTKMRDALRTGLAIPSGPGRTVDREAGWLHEPQWVEGQGCLPVAPWRNAQLLPS